MKRMKILLPLLLLTGTIQPGAAAPPQDIQKNGDRAVLHELADRIEQERIAARFQAQFRLGKPVTTFADYSLAPVRKQAEKQAAWKAELSKVDPQHLNETDRQTFGILQFELSGVAPDEAEYWLTFDLTPYQAPMMIGYANQVLAAQPLETAENAENYLSLIEAYGAMLESLFAKLEAQKARGIYMPKAILPVIRSTWTALADSADELRPAEERLARLDPPARAALNEGFDRVITQRVAPAYANIIAAVGADYEAEAPEAVGIGQYPGGKDVYRKLIRRHTTIDATPEQLHQQGLAAVADISARMEEIRDQLGSSASSRAFYDKLSTDPRFLATSPADVEASYWRYIRAIEPKVADYFRAVPTAPYGVKRLPLAAEQGQTFGYYSAPTKAEPRGIYHYNGSNLEKRSLVNAGTLIYHELIPGHHFQIALQEENAALTSFRKHYVAGAFNEGWGEYAASLGIELGLYDTPEALYGRYVNEMFLAARLVVDTGMNYFGWPLEKARAYMHDVTSLSDVEIASESLRYSVSIPGQALAYRSGYDKFWGLRRHAEDALGSAFDIREFHEVLLSPGARPMAVVEADVDRYVTKRRERFSR